MENDTTGGRRRVESLDVAFGSSLETLHLSLREAIASSRSDTAPLLQWLGIGILVLSIASKLLTVAGISFGRLEPVEFVAVLVTGLALIVTASGVSISANRAAAGVSQSVADAIRGMWVDGEYRRVANAGDPDSSTR